MAKRKLGKSGIHVSAIGVGCWAMGGPYELRGRQIGWGQVDDAESVRAIHRAIDLGATLFDTADVYGWGHSEQVLGQALKGRRDRVVLATKFGNMREREPDEQPEEIATPEFVGAACEASLRRLQTDCIDLYQFHVGRYDLDLAVGVRDALERLVEAGKIRWYGWSTDSPERARLFAEGEHCTAVQQRLNILEGNAETLGICEEFGLASLNRSPLAMGLLTGKFNSDTTFAADDIRSRWDLSAGPHAQWLARFEKVRDVLTADGRTLAQGALGWVLARSDVTIPIPGFRTVAQIEDNLAAADRGPLRAEQMRQIEEILGQE
jgi:aryl-alcohol dehydrogenase-like predicted oxidoreductase